ncbi:unnamed protein product, partial [marine sediment metagenome]
MVNVFFYVEAFYLAAEPYRIFTGVKGFYGGDATFSFAQRSKKAFNGFGQGGDTTHACDNDSPFTHTKLVRYSWLLECT